MLWSEIDLFEDRRADLTYKEKKAKGVIDRVTVELEGVDSARFTRMSRMLKRIDNQITKLQTIRNNVNEKLKGNVEDLFDAEDVMITRVVETVNATLTLSKKSPPGKKSVTDYQKAWNELYEMYPDLKDQLDTLLTKYTKVQDVAEKAPGLRVKDKEAQQKKMESLNEDSSSVLDKIREFASKLTARFQRWAEGYDERLDRVRGLIGDTEQLGEAPVVSSWIDELDYDDASDTVTMHTGGRSYDIDDMDAEDYEDWMTAPSKGRHWHRNVRGIKT